MEARMFPRIGLENVHVAEACGISLEEGDTTLVFRFPFDESRECLSEMKFKTPTGRVSYDNIMAVLSARAASNYQNITLLQPRGLYNVDLNLTHLRVKGNSESWRIMYSDVVDFVILPESPISHAVVILAVNPPIVRRNKCYKQIMLRAPLNADLFKTLDDILDDKKAEVGDFLGDRDGCPLKVRVNDEQVWLYPLQQFLLFIRNVYPIIRYDQMSTFRYKTQNDNEHCYKVHITLKGPDANLRFTMDKKGSTSFFCHLCEKGLKSVNHVKAIAAWKAELMDKLEQQAIHLEKSHSSVAGEESVLKKLEGEIESLQQKIKDAEELFPGSGGM